MTEVQQTATDTLCSVLNDLGALVQCSPQKAHADRAMDWLMCVGRCRSVGVDVVDTFGYVPPLWAARGISATSKYGLPTIARANGLDDVLAYCGYSSFSTTVRELFHSRMQLWYIAIAAKMSMHLHRKETNCLNMALGLGLAELYNLGEMFDRALFKHRETIRRVNCYDLPAWYRADITSPHIDNLPWWLAGGLESSYAHVKKCVAKFEPEVSQNALSGELSILP